MSTVAWTVKSIPRMEYGDGTYGIAPVFASRVQIQTPLSVAAKR